MRSVGTVLALVVLATLVATFARRWRIPAPSLLVVAGLAVALLPGLFSLVRRRGGMERTNWRVPVVLTSAGTRGVMPLAAALSIPEITRGGSAPAGRPPVLVLTTSVVVVTLVVQGFTLAPVVRASGIALEPDHTEREEVEARGRLARVGLGRLEEPAELEAVPDIVVDRLRRGLTARLDDARGRLAEQNGSASAIESFDMVYRQLRRDLIAVETVELQRMYDEHDISDMTRRKLQRSLDLEEARLTGS